MDIESIIIFSFTGFACFALSTLSNGLESFFPCYISTLCCMCCFCHSPCCTLSNRLIPLPLLCRRPRAQCIERVGRACARIRYSKQYNDRGRMTTRWGPSRRLSPVDPERDSTRSLPPILATPTVMMLTLLTPNEPLRRDPASKQRSIKISRTSKDRSIQAAFNSRRRYTLSNW